MEEAKKDNEWFIDASELGFLTFAILSLGLIYLLESNLGFIYKVLSVTLFIAVLLSSRYLSPIGLSDSSLRKKIVVERERLCPGSNSDWQWNSLRRLYDPTIFSLIAIILIGMAINIPAFYFPWFQSLTEVADTDVAAFSNNFIAIHAGIGAIIFALLIFVAESLRDDSKERASVLLKESFLFPLTVLEIITFLFFIGFGGQSLLSGIPIFLVGCLAIHSLYKLMRILLSPYRFRRERLELLKDRVSRSINDALSERIGNNILHKLLEGNDISLSTGYYSKRDRRDSLPFKVTERGVVKDIDLDVLMEIGKLVEEQANSRGFSLFDNKLKPEPSSSRQDDMPTGKTEYYIKLQRWDATLTKFYRQNVEPESDVVLVISKKITGEDSAFESKINDLVKRLFTIEKEDNFSDEIKLELESLRDQFVDAVRQVRIKEIDYFRSVYLTLTETFLDLINKCGGGFTPEQAKKEASASAFKEGWPEIEWLDDHLRDIYKESIRTKNSEVIRKVAFTPIAIAIRGINKNDHFIFQKFIKYARALHYEAWELEKDEDIGLRKDLSNHSIMWLREVSDYHIEPDLEERPDKIQFAFQILIELQAILKHSFDKYAESSFEETLNTINKLLKRFKPSEEFPNVEHLKFDIARIQDEKVKSNLERQLEERIKLEEAERELKSKKRQLLFGFAAWVFKKVRATGEVNHRRMFDKLRSLQPQKIDELTDIFVRASDHDTQDRFGWDWWDIEPDGEVRIIDFGTDVEYLYIILVLGLLSNKTPAEIEALKLPPSRHLAFLAEPQSSLNKKIEEIEISPTLLADYIGTQAREKTQVLKELLNKAKIDQEEIERVEIIGRSLSDKKIREFWDLFIKEFYEHSTLRSLFKGFGKLNDMSSGIDSSSQVKLIGYNQIDNKEGFFEDWHVHYVGWGEQYGEGFARSEDISIYEKIANELVDKSTISFSDLIPSIEQRVERSAFSKPILLSPFAYSIEVRTMKLPEKFIQRWDHRKDHKGYDKYPFYMGFLDLKNTQVPIFRMVRPGPKEINEKDACLIDLERIGVINQYPPINVPEDKQFQKDIFMVKIIDLNSDNEKRQKILAENPSWLAEKQDPDVYLKGKAVINIYSKFEFEVTDNTAGTHFKFKDTDLE
jgi:hypothetical protein